MEFTASRLSPLLTTARLRLAPQVAAHAETMLMVLADSRTHLYIPTQPPTDLAALQARYAALEARRSPDGSQWWLNWTVYTAECAIGTVQATVWPEQLCSSVAYILYGFRLFRAGIEPVLLLLPLVGLDRVQHTDAEHDLIGVRIIFHPDAWGRGYAGEAMHAVLHFLHFERGITRFKAEIDTRNTASQRLAQRLGFIRVDQILGADEFKGAVSDEFIYKLALTDKRKSAG